ncbi:MAG: hypothetical protein AB1797_06535 [bacterium]
MKALILSEYKEGRNSIVGSTKLVGIRLLDRLVLSLKGGGVTEIVITSDPKKEIVRAYMHDEKYGCPIKYAYLKGGNAVSLILKARELLEGEEQFLFTTANCLFYHQTVKAFLASKPQGISVLGGNAPPKSWPNLNRAVKVKVDPQGYVIQIDRNLVDYNLVETGLFCFTHDIFEALTGVESRGGLDWMDGVKILAQKRQIKAVPLKEGYWHKIEGENDLMAAKEDLLTSPFSAPGK